MLLNRLLDDTLAPSLTAEMVGEGVRVSTRAILDQTSAPALR